MGQTWRPQAIDARVPLVVVSCLLCLSVWVLAGEAFQGLNRGEEEFLRGFILYRGADNDAAYREASRHFQKAANAGNLAAQYYLGHMYHHGLGFERDLKSAMK